jgi:hypothetical protein
VAVANSHNHAQTEGTRIVYVVIEWLDTANQKRYKIMDIPQSQEGLTLRLRELTQSLTDTFKVN